MVGVGGWILLVEQLLLELAREASFPFIQNIEKIPREKNTSEKCFPIALPRAREKKNTLSKIPREKEYLGKTFSKSITCAREKKYFE